MLQLVNLSNYSATNKMFANNPEKLQTFLNKHRLDGIEMMFCSPWDEKLHKKDCIYGVHLWFWNDWLDFWQGYFDVLVEQYGSLEQVKQYYGTLNKHDWLALLAQNLQLAQSAQPAYMVFHIANARLQEVYSRKFAYSDREVIKYACELLNFLTQGLPEEVEILLENLWWPGLNLLDKDALQLLFKSIDHPNCGLMLDTGHLANTNLELKTQAQAVDYILKTVDELGEYKNYIKGMHLHCSLTGDFVKANLHKTGMSLYDSFVHVNQVDRHLPFKTPKVKELVAYLQPQYLVHEFISSSLADLEEKIAMQQAALAL